LLKLPPPRASDFKDITEEPMRSRCYASLIATVLALGAIFTSTAFAQQMSAHARAKAQVETRDKRHHNKLKTEAIPTAAGAVAGGVVAGPAGAFAGAKAGHTAGSGFHMIKKHHDIKQQEKRNAAAAHRRYVSHHRTAHATTHRRTLQ
jgi:H+/Cl- antiporter ClcA